MNSPLLGGEMRPRRSTRRRRMLALVAIAVAGAGVWAVIEDDSGRRPVPAAITPNPVALKPPAELTPPVRKGQPPPGIQLVGGRTIHVPFKRPPRAGLVLDMRTGEVVWRRHALKPMPIASLTKIMTAIIVTERTRRGERARVSREALRYTGSGVGVLPKGRRVPVEGLLYGMLLPSGNDAAIALAHHIAGSDRRFARLMNREAEQRGLRCSHFVSSYGLQRGNRSCAADLGALARVAMAQPRIARIVRHPSASVRFPIKGGHLYVNSTNPLLRAGYPGTIGLKTGFTDPAGRCFVAVVRRHGRTFGVVLLHSRNPAKHAQALLKAAFRLR
jgi:serine-type D-Ala-D-Ala carboxypeptidase (penicillin-binding protein 5/6)